MNDKPVASAAAPDDNPRFQAKPAATPVRTWIWGTFFKNKSTAEFEPQPIEVTRQGELKIRREPRIELLAQVQVKAAGGVILTAKSALTDVRIILVNVVALESKYTLNHCINGAAAAGSNRLALSYPVDKGAREEFTGLGLETGDVIRASCTADNDFNCFVYGRRWIP